MENPTGMVWNFIGQPMANVITYFAEEQGLGFGAGIIIVTLLVRFLILPLGLYQSWKASIQSEKMHYLKPILAPLQEKMKTASTQAEQMAVNKPTSLLKKSTVLACLVAWDVYRFSFRCLSSQLSSLLPVTQRVLLKPTLWALILEAVAWS